MKRITTILLAVGLAAACADNPYELTTNATTSNASATQLTVMTRNMYVGTDVDLVLATPDPNQIPFVVGELWQLLLQNDYSERAAAMAAEIAASRPHVVGLQEVSLFRTQTPADFQLNAQDVVIDFVPTLLAELAALGETYVVVGEIENMDVELPRLNPDFTLTDARLTDYDVMIARADVGVSNVASANYADAFPGPFGLSILRGWVAADITVDGQTYRVVTTHLEPTSQGDGLYQGLQADELMAILASESRPTVLLGDLNTIAPSGDTYIDLVADGFIDAWDMRAGSSDPGYTCCHSTDLSSDSDPLNRRLDHVLVRHFGDLWPRGSATPVRAELVGDDVSDKTASGLWPSDHAGMVVTMQLPRPGR